MINFIKILVFVLKFQILASLSIANDNILNEQKIIEGIREINKGDMANFLEKSTELNNIFIEYVKSKKENCAATDEFIETSSEGEKITKKKMLSQKEKNLCLSNLLKFKIRFTQIFFEGRKKYLRYTQEKQYQDLVEFEKNQIEQLLLLDKKYQ